MEPFEQVNQSWLNLRKHAGITWKTQTTLRAVDFCNTPQRVCVNKNCNKGCPFNVTDRGSLKGKAKGKWRKGYPLNKDDRKRIWNQFKAVVGKRALCCNRCRDILRGNIDNFDVETVTVEIPSLDVLDEIPMGYDSESMSDDDDSKQPASSKYRNPAVDIKKISDPEIEIYCGLKRADLLHILEQTNDGLSGKKGDDVLSLEQLFITLTIWRQNLRYRVAAAMFGYKGHSSIIYVVDKVCPYITSFP